MRTHPEHPAHPGAASHSLVQAYLADLDRALAGADPRERADVLDGVREHLSEALGEDTPVETTLVRTVLADLGPVEAIAAQASSAAPVEPPRRDTTSLVALLAAITAAALVFIPFVSIPLAIAALVTSAVHLRAPGANRRRCWAGLWVSVAALVITAVAAATLLMVSSEGVIEPPTAVNSSAVG